MCFQVDRYIISLIILFCLFEVGCNHSVDPGAQERDKLIGNWEWLYSIGDPGSLINPSVIGYSQQLVFKNDGTFQYLRNDTLMKTSQFKTLYQTSSCYSGYGLTLFFGDSSIAKIASDSISNGYHDFVEFRNDTMIWVRCELNGSKDGFRRKK